MKKSVFVAVAIAAGILSLPAAAANVEAGKGSIKKTAAQSAAPTTLVAAWNAAKTDKVPAKEATAKKKPTKAAKAKKPARAAAKKTMINKTGPNKTGAKKVVAQKASLKKAAGKRQRIVIDTSTTSSIAGLKAAATGGKAIRAGKRGSAKVQSARAFSPIVARYASQYGVPVSLAHAVISVESNYNTAARGSAGEIGLMQIKPATARMMGYSGSANGLFDPETNIRYGMKYLAKAHDLGGGDTCGTILRYNAGHGATRMNPVSAAYCGKVKQRLAGL